MAKATSKANSTPKPAKTTDQVSQPKKSNIWKILLLVLGVLIFVCIVVAIATTILIPKIIDTALQNQGKTLSVLIFKNGADKSIDLKKSNVIGDVVPKSIVYMLKDDHFDIKDKGTFTLAGQYLVQYKTDRSANKDFNFEMTDRKLAMIYAPDTKVMEIWDISKVEQLATIKDVDLDIVPGVQVTKYYYYPMPNTDDLFYAVDFNHDQILDYQIPKSSDIDFDKSIFFTDNNLYVSNKGSYTKVAIPENFFWNNYQENFFEIIMNAGDPNEHSPRIDEYHLDKTDFVFYKSTQMTPTTLLSYRIDYVKQNFGHGSVVTDQNLTLHGYFPWVTVTYIDGEPLKLERGNSSAEINNIVISDDNLRGSLAFSPSQEEYIYFNLLGDGKMSLNRSNIGPEMAENRTLDTTDIEIKSTDKFRMGYVGKDSLMLVNDTTGKKYIYTFAVNDWTEVKSVDGKQKRYFDLMTNKSYRDKGYYDSIKDVMEQNTQDVVTLTPEEWEEKFGSIDDRKAEYEAGDYTSPFYGFKLSTPWEIVDAKCSETGEGYGSCLSSGGSDVNAHKVVRLYHNVQGEKMGTGFFVKFSQVFLPKDPTLDDVIEETHLFNKDAKTIKISGVKAYENTKPGSTDKYWNKAYLIPETPNGKKGLLIEVETYYMDTSFAPSQEEYIVEQKSELEKYLESIEWTGEE